MNTTTHLARHMLSFQPNKDAARLCLYHYLIHHCDPDTPLTPLLFENFCRLALVHEHWQNNCTHLSQELQYVLQHYNETFMLDWSMKDFVFPDYWQVVSIKNSIEGIYIYEKWLERSGPAESKKKVIFTKDKSYLVLIQNKDQQLSVIQGSPLILIRKGELEPLTMSIRLEYDENLELKSETSHYLKVDHHSYGRFIVKNKKVSGMIIRGYIFQNQMQAEGRINQYPNLYYPLKKIEQYFIDRKSDPDYVELVEVLEKAVELFRIHHPEARSFGEAAWNRGQDALENIFINDNVISALVDQLGQHFRPTIKV
jgi:hypothetical protein